MISTDVINKAEMIKTTDLPKYNFQSDFNLNYK